MALVLTTPGKSLTSGETNWILERALTDHIQKFIMELGQRGTGWFEG